MCGVSRTWEACAFRKRRPSSYAFLRRRQLNDFLGGECAVCSFPNCFSSDRVGGCFEVLETPLLEQESRVPILECSPSVKN